VWVDFSSTRTGPISGRESTRQIVGTATTGAEHRQGHRFVTENGMALLLIAKKPFVLPNGSIVTTLDLARCARLSIK
jgi:hypothetical protein